MEPVLTILSRIAPLGWRVRWCRGVYYGCRWLLYSLLASLPLLLMKSILPFPPALGVLGLILIGISAGSIYGLTQPVSPLSLARLVEERLDLKARLSTAIEYHSSRDRSPLAQALYRDALKALPASFGKEILPPRIPGEFRYIFPTAIAVLLLLQAPPLSFNRLGTPPFTAERDQGKGEGEGSRGALEGARSPAGKDRVEPPKIKDRLWGLGKPPPPRSLQEMAALFKDSPLGVERPDFSSFLRGGDDRMKLLGGSRAIPNLRREDLRSPYHIVIEKMRELAGDRGVSNLTPEEVGRLLTDIQRMGKGGGSRGAQGPFVDAEDLRNLSPEGMREALERALDEMRGVEESKLKGSEVSERRGPGPEVGKESQGDEGPDEMFGSLPGTGRSETLQGAPSPRLRSSPWDTGLKGQLRDGRSEAYNTNLLGAGEGGKPTLPQIDILTKYRQMVEEVLSREPIPPDYREQVKTYFDSLERSRGDDR